MAVLLFFTLMYLSRKKKQFYILKRRRSNRYRQWNWLTKFRYICCINFHTNAPWSGMNIYLVTLYSNSISEGKIWITKKSHYRIFLMKLWQFTDNNKKEIVESHHRKCSENMVHALNICEVYFARIFYKRCLWKIRPISKL